MKSEIFVTDSNKLPHKMKLQLVKLVGERPLVNVRLNGKGIRGLWDTGAMISLINENLLQELFLLGSQDLAEHRLIYQDHYEQAEQLLT